MRIPCDAVGETFAQANDSYSVTFVLYKIRMTISSFSYIFYLLDSNLSGG